MTNKNLGLLEDLKKQIDVLVSTCNSLKKEKEQYLLEKLNLLEQIEILTQNNKKLENQYQTLKVAESLSGISGNEDAKKRINNIVREIDKCIALLNV